MSSNQKILKELQETDEFYEFKDWPLWAKQSFLNKHKDRKQRFWLWLFLWKNGMRPERAVYWVMRHGGYDRNAWSSLQDLVKQTYTKEGRSYLTKQGFAVYDMETGLVQ